jgi:hypothetical protein
VSSRSSPIRRDHPVALFRQLTARFTIVLQLSRRGVRGGRPASRRRRRRVGRCGPRRRGPRRRRVRRRARRPVHRRVRRGGPGRRPGRQAEWVRVDSAGYQQQVIAAAERYDAWFTVTARQLTNVKDVIDDLASDRSRDGARPPVRSRISAVRSLRPTSRSPPPWCSVSSSPTSRTASPSTIRSTTACHRATSNVVWAVAVCPPAVQVTSMGHSPGVVFDPTVQVHDTDPSPSAIFGCRPRALLGPLM